MVCLRRAPLIRDFLFAQPFYCRLMLLLRKDFFSAVTIYKQPNCLPTTSFKFFPPSCQFASGRWRQVDGLSHLHAQNVTILIPTRFRGSPERWALGLACPVLVSRRTIWNCSRPAAHLVASSHYIR